LPAERLSMSISGKRLQELNPMALLREMLLGDAAKPGHLEGQFYYPRGGYGMIADALARACGAENIQLNSPVIAVHHDGSRLQAISVGTQGQIPVEQVINTLPLPLLLRLMDPPPPAEHLQVAASLRFRNLIVVALFLDMGHVSESASLYFPDRSIPFTRAYEPRNRSPLMAPPGKTSLCVEYPCFPADDIWTSDDASVVTVTVAQLQRLGMLKGGSLLGSRVVRLDHAYPVLEAGIEEKVELLLRYLSKFSNLRVVGRNGRFVYSHVHDMLRFGLDVIGELAGIDVPRASTAPS
jgi:protoporphyrinogen oxidase